MGNLIGWGSGKPHGPQEIIGPPPRPPLLTVKFVPSKPSLAATELQREHDVEAFKAAAYAGVRWRALHQLVITTDDIWAYLETFQSSLTPEPRVLGLVMKQAQKDGLIAPAPSYKRSRRKKNHGRMVREWVSLVYGRSSNQGAKA
jgi:hypothetical protein